MKRKSLIYTIMIMALLMALVMSSCEKKPETLEEFVNSNEESMEDIQKTADESGLKVDIKGNEVTYSYDISDYDGMTEEIAKGDQMKKALEDALNDASDTFTGLCGDLEEESGIEGVTIKVNYTFKDENLITKVYDKSGIVEK
ncbi:MAG: DUF4854 domain-containing protein [Mogibacterium sp.]|nr:DUF4854 domain-containing protein [Mogibacterium sp.]